jgi:Kef-type K+ transport system membrane component KefB
MSGAAPKKPKRFGRTVLEAVLLVVIGGLLFAATRVFPETHGGVGLIAAVGFLLLAGTLMSELVEIVKMPHLTGYLLAGIIGGPHVLRLVDHHAVERLSSVNALALALIALEGGAELKLDFVKKGVRSLAWASLLQSTVVFVLMAGIFMASRKLIPFTQDLTLPALVGVGLLWGILGITRSPSATLGILSQTRAQGPIARFTLTFVMTSDIIVVVLLAAGLTVARPLIQAGASLSGHAFRELGYEVLGSVALGTTLGIVLAAYMRIVNKALVVVFVVLGFGLTEVLRYLNFDPLLTFMVAGFLVQNLSKQGEKFLHAIQATGGIVYVIFFATAGAHLDIPLLRQLWPVALVLAGSRAFITWVTARLACRMADDPPVLRNWAWSGLISQAGLALGLAGLVAREFPAFGDGFRALAIATVALNEMFGPILFKFALDRSGETSTAPVPALPSIRPPAPDPGE